MFHISNSTLKTTLALWQIQLSFIRCYVSQLPGTKWEWQEWYSDLHMQKRLIKLSLTSLTPVFGHK